MRSESIVAPVDDYRLAVAAMVIADGDEDARAAVDALSAAGIRVATRVRFGDALRELEAQAMFEHIRGRAGRAPALVERVLAQVAAIAAERDAAVVATLDEHQIDFAIAHLPGTRGQVLCRPTAVERFCAMVLAKARSRGRLHESSRNDDGLQLQRLNEEVARIAETLARLSRSEDTVANALRETGPGYRGPEDSVPGTTSAGEIRATIRARRMRSQFFAGELFADPAWDMLLDLFAAALGQQRVSVSSLCIAASVPPTTALRWISALHVAGLFERQADPSDRRRAYVALSPDGLKGMHAYAAAVKRAGLPIV